MSESSELLPCPFCGTSHSLLPGGSGRHQAVICESCGASGPEVYRSLPWAVAANAWNVRSAPSDVNVTHRATGATAAESQRIKPLSDEQIIMIGKRSLDKCAGIDAQHIYIAREVERAHNITEESANG